MEGTSGGTLGSAEIYFESESKAACERVGEVHQEKLGQIDDEDDDNETVETKKRGKNDTKKDRRIRSSTRVLALVHPPGFPIFEHRKGYGRYKLAPSYAKVPCRFALASRCHAHGFMWIAKG